MNEYKILPSVSFPNIHHYYDFITNLEIKIVVGKEITTNYLINKAQRIRIKNYFVKLQIKDELLNTL